MSQPLIIKGQPFELLVKQLSDSNLTLKDFNNFCNSNSELRKESILNPVLRSIRENKTPIIDIEVKFTKRYTDKAVMVNLDTFKSSTHFYRYINIKFYNRIKDLILTNTIKFEDLIIIKYDLDKDYIPKNMNEVFEKEYRNKYDLDDEDVLFWFEKFKREGKYERIYDSSMYFKLITCSDGSKYVHIYDIGNNSYDFIIPFNLLESAMDIARSISDNFKNGKATINLDGSIVYKTYESIEIIKDFY